jgi:hypothetical protein
MEDGKKLPGWAFMLVGLAIMGYTKFIQLKQPTAKIGIFFWVGIAFLVFGLLREFVPRILTKKPKKELVGPPPGTAAMRAQTQPLPTHHPAQHAVPPHATHQHVTPQQYPSHPYQPQHKQCPRCHQLTHGTAKFCHSCGHQFY